MARVTYTALISKITGSIGGLTFQVNPSGHILRSKPQMPAKPMPAANIQQRNISLLTAAWPSLSNANKVTWSDFATAHQKVNEWSISKYLNGFQWYLSCNLNLLIVDEATIDAAPIWEVMTVPDAFTIYTDVDDIKVDFGAEYTAPYDYVMVYASPPIRQSSIKLRRSLKLILITSVSAQQYISLTASYSSLFNLIWSDLYNDSDCSIIVRLKFIKETKGLSGPFTSAITKLN
jgi:hypothetical protein